jgi:hypothetical protein
MRHFHKYIILGLLTLLTACAGITGNRDKEPEPELWTNSDDFYASLWEEINYTPDRHAL